MIHLSPNTYTGRWFVWICDHLPMSTSRDRSVNETEGVRRTADHYLDHGTTLCHVFWVNLWVPVIWTAIATMLMFIIGMMHYVPGNDPAIRQLLGYASVPLPGTGRTGFRAARRHLRSARHGRVEGRPRCLPQGAQAARVPARHLQRFCVLTSFSCLHPLRVVA